MWYIVFEYTEFAYRHKIVRFPYHAYPGPWGYISLNGRDSVALPTYPATARVLHDCHH